MSAGTGSREPDVDLVIAVHSAERRVEDAVGSVLRGTRGDVRVTVVCHGLPAGDIAARLGALADDARVRLVRHDDGVRSPAGPFNAGLALATGTFTSVMGSDDTLEPGAVDSWLALAARFRADVVVARLRHASGAGVPTPPVRPTRRGPLDGVRDRLSYRSAPLGLVRRERFGGLRFTEGLAVGEDIPYVTRLWFSGARVLLDRRGPAYLIGAEATDRVTLAPRPVADELAYVPALLDDPWFAARSTDERLALVVKLLRVQVFGAVAGRPDPMWWTTAERADLARLTGDLVRAAPEVRRVLSRADGTLLDAIMDPASLPGALLEASAARRRFGRPATLLPAALAAVLHREAPMRWAAASWLVARQQTAQPTGDADAALVAGSAGR